jgi:hypothetical protein
MAVIKLKQKDIEKIVSTLVNEQMSDTETPIDNAVDVDNQPGIELSMMMDQNGKFYAVDMKDPNNPRVVAQTK